MKIKYEFVTETVEVEVSAEWAELLKECDRIEYNNNHKETRRHTSLDCGIDYSDWLMTEESDPYFMIDVAEENRKACEAFELLTEAQRTLVERIYFDGMSVNEYAVACGVDQSAISHRISRIRKKLKKYA